MRIMGLDFGSKTTGVAVSDPLGITAQGIETITRKDENKLRQTCARIEELIREYEVGTIVLGYPKNMNNTLGERVEKTHGILKRCWNGGTNLPVVIVGRAPVDECGGADPDREWSAPGKPEERD